MRECLLFTGHHLSNRKSEAFTQGRCQAAGVTEAHSLRSGRGICTHISAITRRNVSDSTSPDAPSFTVLDRYGFHLFKSFGPIVERDSYSVHLRIVC